jgi:hypothetical protein
MKNRFSAFAIPSAIALLFASVGVTAQDKPNPASSKKSAASAVSVSKASKPTGQTPARSNGVAAKGAGERATVQPGTPDAAPVVPSAERSYGGCHDKDSDA